MFRSSMVRARVLAVAAAVQGGTAWAGVPSHVTLIKAPVPALGYTTARPGTGGPSSRISSVDVGRFPVVSLGVTALDGEGRPVSGLTKESFEVLEDGKPVPVLAVSAEDSPVTVGLLLDVSSGMAEVMPRLKQAVGEAIHELGDGDDLMVFTFGDRARELSGSGRRELIGQVQQLEAAGARALNDGLELALRRLRQRSGRRVLVCFTGGRDQDTAGVGPQSTIGERQVARLAFEARIPIDTIALGGRADGFFLGKLASLTGGHDRSASDSSHISGSFTAAMAPLHQQVQLSFRSPRSAADGTRRQLAITVRGEGGEGPCATDYLAPETPVPTAAVAMLETAVTESGAPRMSRIAGKRNVISHVRVTGFPDQEFAGYMHVLERYRNGQWSRARGHAEIGLSDEGESDVLKFRPGAYRFSIKGPSSGDPVLFSVDLRLRGGESVVITPDGAQLEPAEEESSLGEAEVPSAAADFESSESGGETEP